MSHPAAATTTINTSGGVGVDVEVAERCAVEDHRARLVAPHPARFHRVWSGQTGTRPIFFWQPVPPSDDFVALGFVGSGDPDDPPKVAVASLRCVHRSLCTQGSTVPELTVTSTAEPAGPIWRYRGKTSRGSPSPKRRIPGQHSLF